MTGPAQGTRDAPPLHPVGAVRDTALAVGLGVLLSAAPLLAWLALSPQMRAARWNPLADRTAWRVQSAVGGPEVDAVVARARRWLAQRGLDGNVRVAALEGRTWIELLGPGRAEATALGREVVGVSGIWDGTLEIGGGSPVLLLDELRAGGFASSTLAVLVAFPLAGMALAFLWRGTRRRPRPPPGWRAPAAPAVVLGAGVAGGAALLGGAFGLDALLAQVGLAQAEQPLLLAVARFEGWVRVVFVLVVVGLAPVAEELFFRRRLFRGLLASRGRATAYALSAALFAVVHLHPPALPTYVAYGLGLAWLYERTRHVGTPIIAHVCVNGTATALLFTG